MQRPYINSYDVRLSRITACLALSSHAFFILIDPINDISQQFPRYDELMIISRYVVWIPSILIVLSITYMNEKIRSLIPIAASVAIMLHGLGFVLWAFVLGEKGPEYTRAPILMVTIMAYFTCRIPFRYALTMTSIYTLAFLGVSLKCWLDIAYGLSDITISEKVEEIFMIMVSTIGSAILITFCAYQTESVRKRLEESRAFIKSSKSSRYRWLENMASFLRHEIENKHIAANQSINLLRAREKQNSQVTKYCERASRSLAEMKYLVDQTVKATNVETALMSSEDEPLRFDHLIRWYVASRISGDNKLSINFINKTRTGQSIIYGDKQRLEQMIEKIVSNAIDFSSEGREIRLVLSQLDQTLNLEVENDGPLLPENSEHIFDFTYSSRDSDDADAKNAGFGLYIARRIAEHHSGCMVAYNRKDGSGPTIAVSLPQYSQSILAG